MGTSTVITVQQVIDLGEGVFKWLFSDGTYYITPSLKGDRGPQGDAGPRGKEGQKGESGNIGISVHHIRLTNTTDPDGVFSSFGELDTYTIYGDADEDYVLGWFSVRNGATGSEGIEDILEDLKDRSVHTGFQKMNTITGLLEALESRVVKDGNKVLSDINFSQELYDMLFDIPSSLFKGLFSSYDMLVLEHPMAAAGSYAQTDSKDGSKVDTYMYDSVSNSWTKQDGESGLLTAPQVRELLLANADTNILTDALKNSLEQLPAAVLLKQDKLKSGINIKSVNGQSLVGSGNLEVKGGGDVLQVTGTSTTAVMSQNAVTRVIGDLPSILDAINGEVV